MGHLPRTKISISNDAFTSFSAESSHGVYVFSTVIIWQPADAHDSRFIDWHRNSWHIMPMAMSYTGSKISHSRNDEEKSRESKATVGIE